MRRFGRECDDVTHDHLDIAVAGTNKCSAYLQRYNNIDMSLNAGLVSNLNYGNISPRAISVITFAHEIGHNMGSPVCVHLNHLTQRYDHYCNPLRTTACLFAARRGRDGLRSWRHSRQLHHVSARHSSRQTQQHDVLGLQHRLHAHHHGARCERRV